MAHQAPDTELAQPTSTGGERKRKITESFVALAMGRSGAQDAAHTALELARTQGQAPATNNALGVVEIRMPAGFSPPPHIHHDEDEAFYLLSGRIEAQLGDQKIPAQQGSFLWLPRNVLHGFVVSAEGPCMILTIATPAGFAGFVAEVGAATTTTDRLPEPSEPDIPRLVEIAGRYGIEFPPPPND